MRLFVAIELDDPARQAIAAEQKRLRAIAGKQESSIRWVGEAQLHLTLAFIGEVNPSAAEPLIAAMRSPIDRPVFDVVFGGLGVFPLHGAPRALWVGLSQGADDVVAMQRIVADRIAAVGLPLDQRPFHPHLTVGRWRSSRPSDRRRLLDADRGGAVARVSVTDVALIESQLSSDAPKYIVLCRSALAG